MTDGETAGADPPGGAGVGPPAFSWELGEPGPAGAPEGSATGAAAQPTAPPVPPPVRVWVPYALGLLAGAMVGFFGYPVVVGANLRHASEAITALSFVAGSCAVVGLALGIALDAAAMARAERPVRGPSPAVWALAVVLLAIVAVPIYLYLRAKATPLGRPSDPPPGNPVLGAVLGVVAVGAASTVAFVAVLAASGRFGVAIDPGKVEAAIARSTTNDPLASVGITNVSCSVPGLLHVGDTFTCSQQTGSPFGSPLLTTSTTDPFGLPGISLPKTTTYTVTVTDEDGTVTWRRSS